MNGRTDGWMGWYKYEWLIFRGCRHSTTSQPAKAALERVAQFQQRRRRRPKDVLKITGHVLMTTAIHPSTMSIVLIEFAIMGSIRTSNDTIYIPKLYCPPHQRQTTYDKHDDDVNLWGSRRRLRPPLNGIPIKLTSNVNDEVTVQR